MTTYVNFTPTALAPFTFNPTLDGNVYSATVTWNTFGQRYYITVSALDGTPVFTLPVIGSPPIFSIESLTWSNGFVTAVLSVPHNFAWFQTVELTVSGCQPDAYNGVVDAFITGPLSFQYPLAIDPGLETQLGSVAYDINMAEQYFIESTLVYRAANQQFEINP